MRNLQNANTKTTLQQQGFEGGDGSSDNRSPALSDVIEKTDSFDSAQLTDYDSDGDEDGKQQQGKSPHGGYTYWKRDISDAYLLPSSLPQKIETVVATTQSSTTNTISMSAWNKLGTWEERNVSKKVESRICELLKQHEIKINATCSIQLNNVYAQSCESTICFIRGKPKFGYEIVLAGSWNVIKGPTLSGNILVQNFTDHDEEPDITLSPNFEAHDSSNVDKNIEVSKDSHARSFWSCNRRAFETKAVKILKLLAREIGNELTSS